MKRNIVVKIKYKGMWRKVVGITYNNGVAYYMAQANDKIGYQPVRVGSAEITDFVKEYRCNYPSTKRKTKQLDHTTKMLIYHQYISGNYYQKELCNIYNITPYTLEKVMEEIKNEL